MNKITEMDETNYKILEFLQEDGRMSQRKISKIMGLSVGTIANRINKMKEENIIQGFEVKLNDNKLGFKIKAMINLNSKENIDFDYRNKHIITEYYLTGKYNIILLAKFKNKDELCSFISILLKNNDITEINVQIILKEKKIRQISESDEEFLKKVFNEKNK